jgi:type II secretory pathway pseudopilin PulG
MMNPMIVPMNDSAGDGKGKDQSGFTLVEFLISSLILIVVASAVFALLSEIQRTASYQTEVQSVLNNTRIAMQTVERYIRQAGNDPLGSGLSGIVIVSTNEIQVRSDLTGSSGTGNPDKGDPDGDIEDSGENVTIRLNDRSRSLEIVPDGGSAQIVASNIAGLSFECFDSQGSLTTASGDIRKVVITIKGSSSLPNPQTHQVFGVKLSSGVNILT